MLWGLLCFVQYYTARSDRFTGKEARSKEVLVSIPQHSEPCTQTLATITSITKLKFNQLYCSNLHMAFYAVQYV